MAWQQLQGPAWGTSAGSADCPRALKLRVSMRSTYLPGASRRARGTVRRARANNKQEGSWLPKLVANHAVDAERSGRGGQAQQQKRGDGRLVDGRHQHHQAWHGVDPCAQRARLSNALQHARARSSQCAPDVVELVLHGESSRGRTLGGRRCLRGRPPATSIPREQRAPGTHRVPLRWSTSCCRMRAFQPEACSLTGRPSGSTALTSTSLYRSTSACGEKKGKKSQKLHPGRR